MKVAFIVGGLPFGGVENSLFDIAVAAANDNRLELFVINISGTGDKQKDFEAAGIKVYTCGSSKSVLKIQKFGTALKLRKLLKELNPDIIHTAHFSADYFGRLASIGLGKKVITHLRNTKEEKKGHRNFLNRYLSRYTDLYLSVSLEVMKTVEKMHNASGRPSLLLYNFFDPANAEKSVPYEKSEFDLEGKTVIASCGRLVPQKNVDKIIKAMPAILKENSSVHYLVIGDGTHKKEYEKLAEELGVKDSVTFLGYRKDVFSILKMADIYCMPSEYEGFGIAHLEAMAVGLPSVVSRSVHTLEFSSDFTYVCETTAESIAERIIHILRNPEEAAGFAEAGLKKAKEFTVSAYMDKLTDIYSSLLEGRL